MVCDKDLAEEEREDEEELEGYRIKNKNPTQRCGELCPIKKNTAHFEGSFSSSDSQPRSSRQDRTMNCDGHVWIGILGRVLQIIPDEFET